MVAAAKLKALAARKELLAREAELRRALLTAEAQDLDAALAWVGRARGVWQAARPWAFLATPVAGLAFARRAPRLLRLALKGAAGWSVARELWRGFRAKRKR